MNEPTSRCGKRGCKVVELPFDLQPNGVNCGGVSRFISIYRLSDRRTPSWQVVRWDIDETTAQYRKAVG